MFLSGFFNVSVITSNCVMYVTTCVYSLNKFLISTFLHFFRRGHAGDRKKVERCTKRQTRIISPANAFRKRGQYCEIRNKSVAFEPLK